ncbi:MAG: RNA 2',3'-cyclic phosphodiesterase [Deltaproteobacteria bacterium]|nr:RNA 2',3'-cyclic phosphodiesterase [Deltaproteobacteria bacterium]
MADEKRIRTFLAIDLSDEVRGELAAIQRRLKSALEGVRWTRPEGIHLTLKFFGDIDNDAIGSIADIVEKRTKGFGPLSLAMGAMGAFPNLGRARVLWLGLEGEIEKLASLQESMEDDFEVLGFVKETRSFKPHLTLGRARSSRGMITGLREAMESIRYENQSPFSAEGLTLFKSDLAPGGAVYTKLAYFSFGG